jgi:hypothetical protein
MYGTRIPIDKAVKFSSSIFTDPAKTPFSLRDTALPGTKLTLYFPLTQGGEKGREFCFNEAFFGCLCLHGFRIAKELSSIKNTESSAAALQEIPFCQTGLNDALTIHAGSYFG